MNRMHPHTNNCQMESKLVVERTAAPEPPDYWVNLDREEVVTHETTLMACYQYPDGSNSFKDWIPVRRITAAPEPPAAEPEAPRPFSVGDRVRFISGRWAEGGFPNGVITTDDGSGIPYCIELDEEFNGFTCVWDVAECLQLITSEAEPTAKDSLTVQRPIDHLEWLGYLEDKADLIANLDAANAAQLDQVNTINRLLEQVEQAEDSLAQAKAMNKALEVETRDLKAAMSQAEDELTQSQVMNNLLEAERDKLAERVKELEAEVETLGATHKPLFTHREHVARLTGELETLRARLTQIDAAARELPEMPPIYSLNPEALDRIDSTEMEAYAALMRDTAASLKARVEELEQTLDSVTPEKDAEGIILKAKLTLKGKPSDSLIQLCIERSLTLDLAEVARNAALADAEGLRRENQELTMLVKRLGTLKDRLNVAKDEAATAERERLMPWVMHKNGCPTGRYSATKPPCTCGLREALAPTENKEK